MFYFLTILAFATTANCYAQTPTKVDSMTFDQIEVIAKDLKLNKKDCNGRYLSDLQGRVNRLIEEGKVDFDKSSPTQLLILRHGGKCKKANLINYDK